VKRNKWSGKGRAKTGGKKLHGRLSISCPCRAKRVGGVLEERTHRGGRIPSTREVRGGGGKNCSNPQPGGGKRPLQIGKNTRFASRKKKISSQGGGGRKSAPHAYAFLIGGNGPATMTKGENDVKKMSKIQRRSASQQKLFSTREKETARGKIPADSRGQKNSKDRKEKKVTRKENA